MTRIAVTRVVHRPAVIVSNGLVDTAAGAAVGIAATPLSTRHGPVYAGSSGDGTTPSYDGVKLEVLATGEAAGAEPTRKEKQEAIKRLAPRVLHNENKRMRQAADDALTAPDSAVYAQVETESLDMLR
jgi:hypothetical protein